MADKNNYMENNDQIPHMKSLALCINKVVLDGYEDDFKVMEDGKLSSIKTDQHYTPDQVNVVNFFRFEGQSDPDDNTILYVIETSDGLKGTLVDAYGAYADERVSTFFNHVDQIHKKTNHETIEKHQ